MRRLPPIALLLVALAAPVAIGLGARDASASVAYESPYTFEQTFGTALRLVRVDLGFKLVEKDVANGYLLFEYRSPESGSRVTQGSIEVEWRWRHSPSPSPGRRTTACSSPGRMPAATRR